MQRTPTKPGSEDLSRTMTLAGAGPGPETEKGELTPHNVRRSIGDWETGKPDRSRPSVTPPQNPQAAAPLKAYPASRKLLTVTSVSPPKPAISKTSEKVAEARSWLIKGKQHVHSSKNLKTDIKQGVLQALERLYQLVKESNLDKSLETTAKPAEPKNDEIAIEKNEERKEKDRELEKILAKHTELIKENNERMEKLKELLTNKTYASAVMTSPRRQLPEHTVMHSVVVTAKDETETGDEVLTRIRKAVNAKEGGVAVERIRKAKDRKVIVGCRTEEERRKVKERLSGTPELKVEEIKNKDPLVMLRSVLHHNSDEDILRAMKNQNKNIYKDLAEKDAKTEIAFKKRTRNPHTSHVVLRVSPMIWKRMLEAEAVHIDLQRVKVEDQSPLVQCSQCLGYGHGRRFCTNAIEKCSHCGGPHMKAKCEEWLTGTTPTCCNCVTAKQDRHDHNAFSSECPVRRRWDALARAAVAYC